MIAHLLEILRGIHPAWLVAAMALLPLIGFPISPLWVLTGIRLGPGWGLAAAVAGLVVNNTLAYELAARWFRRPIRQWLERRGHKIPVLNARDEAKLILVCRLTPGFPLPAQNYFLGCAHVNYTRFQLLSLPVQSGWALAFVVFGNSVTHSAVWPIVLAVCLMVVVGIVISALRKRFVRNSGISV